MTEYTPSMEAIREELALVKGQSWRGEYPVEDIEFLLARIDKLESDLADADADAKNAYAIASNVWREEYDKLKTQLDTLKPV